MKTYRDSLLGSLAILLGTLLVPSLASAQVTPVTPETVASTPESQPASFPALAASPEGDFLVAWRAGGGQPPATSPSGIFARRFDDSGAPAGQALRVNDSPLDARISGPSMAINFDRTPMVVWQGAGADSSGFAPIIGRFLDPLGNPTAREIPIAARGREPRVAALSNGFFVVVWESAPADLSRIELLARLYDRFAVPFGDVFQVPRRQSYTFQGGAEVAGSPDGGFVVVWERGQRRPEIVGRRFDNFGAPRGDEFLIDTRPRVTQPAVAFAPDGRFTVVWTRIGLVYGRRYNANGRPSGPAFPISAVAREGRTQPVIAFDAEGRSVVAWNRSRHPTAMGQAFDSAGRFAGGHFFFSKNMMYEPAIQVAFLSNGRLAAAWRGLDLPFVGGSLEILIRLFELSLP